MNFRCSGLLFVILLCASCAEDGLVARLEKIEIEYLIRTDGSGHWPYFDNEDLVKEYRRSRSRMNEIEEIVHSPSASVGLKILAVRVAQCLDEREYLNFVNRLLDHSSSGRIPVEVVATAVYPGAEWGVHFIFSHDDVQVKEMLDRAKIVLEGSKFEELPDSISSGEAADFVREYSAQGEVFPRILCNAPEAD